MIRLLTAMLTAFAVCLVLMPVVILAAKKLKLRQTILNYVDNHSSKSGTPTMGGVAFVISGCLAAIFFSDGNNSLTVMTVAVTVGFAVIGFLDDFIKIFYKQNKGLSVWQKIIFQTAVAAIIAVFAYNSDIVSDKLYIPFVLNEFSLGLFAVPFYMFIFIAFTNAVNLTDGLDGLAGGVTAVYLLFFGAVLAVIVYYSGAADGLVSAEYYNLMIFCAAFLGALVAFLVFNGFPAKIFMGDTGALALGAAVAGLAVMSKLSLTAPIIGIMFVVSCVSDVIQVLHYKRTKKRVFLMAPFHHHLERKNIHENKIVSIYCAVTFIMGALTVLIMMAVN